MAETRNTLALILDRQAYRENDSLITAYIFDAGKMNLVARGTKKLKSKMAGHLEPISLSELMLIKGRGKDYIGGARGANQFLRIKGDLNKLYYVGQAIRIFSRFTREGQFDQALFFLLQHWLEFIDDYSGKKEGLDKVDGQLFLNFFIIRLLAILGYQPEMHTCSFCQKEIKAGKNYFNLIDGAMLGAECWEENRASFQSNEILAISDNCVKLIRFIINNDLKQAKQLRVDKKLMEEMSVLVNNFLNFRL